MGILGKIRTFASSPAKTHDEIAKILPLADCGDDCNTCPTSDTHERFPSSMKIEQDIPLWGSAPPFGLQILVATGKSDWLHDISEEQGSIAEQLQKSVDRYSKIIGAKVKMNATAQAPNDEHEEGSTSKVLLLPYFVSVENTTVDTVQDDLLKLIEAYNNNSSAAQLVNELQLSSAQVKLSNNLGYIILCSHKTRDKRCGITAPILKRTFETELRHHDLYRDPIGDDRPGGVQVILTSHLGGHKFNANVIIYLKTGQVIWMARVNPSHVEAIVKYTILQGKVFPDMLRQAFKTKGVSW